MISFPIGFYLVLGGTMRDVEISLDTIERRPNTMTLGYSGDVPSTHRQRELLGSAEVLYRQMLREVRSDAVSEFMMSCPAFGGSESNTLIWQTGDEPPVGRDAQCYLFLGQRVQETTTHAVDTTFKTLTRAFLEESQRS